MKMGEFLFGNTTFVVKFHQGVDIYRGQGYTPNYRFISKYSLHRDAVMVFTPLLTHEVDAKFHCHE